MAVTPADIADELDRTAPEQDSPIYKQWARWIARALRTIERIGPYNHVLDCVPVGDLAMADIGDVPFRGRYRLEECHEDIEDCDQEVVRWLTGSVDDAPDDVQEEEMDPRWAALKGLGSDEDEKTD